MEAIILLVLFLIFPVTVFLKKWMESVTGSSINSPLLFIGVLSGLLAIWVVSRFFTDSDIISIFSLIFVITLITFSFFLIRQKIRDLKIAKWINIIFPILAFELGWEDLERNPSPAGVGVFLIPLMIAPITVIIHLLISSKCKKT